MSSRRCFVPAIVAMLTAAAAAPSLATVGRFVATDGAPIAGAEVTFASGPMDVFDAFTPARLVTAPHERRVRRYHPRPPVRPRRAAATASGSRAPHTHPAQHRATDRTDPERPPCPHRLPSSA